MDGASKFVKGDAIAGIIITIINLFGGFIVGVMQNGLSLGESIETYSLLTVGDGLVSQIPALLLSVASGLIVTRAASVAALCPDVASHFGHKDRPLRLPGIPVACLANITRPPTST